MCCLRMKRIAQWEQIAVISTCAHKHMKCILRPDGFNEYTLVYADPKTSSKYFCQNIYHLNLHGCAMAWNKQQTSLL